MYIPKVMRYSGVEVITCLSEWVSHLTFGYAGFYLLQSSISRLYLAFGQLALKEIINACKCVHVQ